MLKITNLLYTVESKILFENCSINIPYGKYCLIGNNGIGKSTLLDLITKQLKPEAGQIEVEKSYIYINQSPQLFANVSVKDNINYFNKKNKKKIITELEAVGIKIKSKFKNLSGGQQQLVYLQICLYSDYQLYIIDEPFNNLDKKHVKYIFDLIDSKQNIIVVDHLQNFDYSKLYIEKRGIRWDG